MYDQQQCNLGICTLSQNDVISSVRKHYCVLALVLWLELGLAEILFQSNLFTNKCSRPVTISFVLILREMFISNQIFHFIFSPSLNQLAIINKLNK